VAAVDAGVPALLLDGGGPASADIADLLALLHRRGAQTALCSNEDGANLPLPPRVPEALATILATVRGQQLALALARARGRNPDAPTGLSKVTPTR